MSRYRSRGKYILESHTEFRNILVMNGVCISSIHSLDERRIPTASRPRLEETHHRELYHSLQIYHYQIQLYL
jgi:hypothetical protein